MKTKLVVLMMLLGTTLFAETHISIGIGVGHPIYIAPPPPPPIVAYAPPPCPGPGYTWITGYWYPVGAHYSWRAGYWARAPYAGAYWIAPRYYDHHYYPGGWERHERHERFERRWDRHDRDRHEREYRRDNGRHRGWYR